MRVRLEGVHGRYASHLAIDLLRDWDKPHSRSRHRQRGKQLDNLFRSGLRFIDCTPPDQNDWEG